MMLSSYAITTTWHGIEQARSYLIKKVRDQETTSM